MIDTTPPLSGVELAECMLNALALSSPLCEVLGHDAKAAAGDLDVMMMLPVGALELDGRVSVLSCQLEDQPGDGGPFCLVLVLAQAAFRRLSLSRLVGLYVQACALLMSGQKYRTGNP